ncbi:ribosomal protein S18-alanine N-acetyltransferase [Mailhella massiliensis]|uniref:Ribosomal protein S18-alanine N-acetyltransferase n=1 Tax=Mailhella massiliensis TaxID=1903261 RepID=A0A921AXY8_9BACT|nr:ribosomal protein S18-alanine N-acetyltransferase [Mailhella massiliensis]HJD98370.1 ribosomal protein S18-alanine N-acetyltransferase [Mailhella massiliensis]
MEEIRPLELEDMPETAALEKRCFSSSWTVQQFVEAWRQDWFAGYGLFREGRLLGYITLCVLAGELEVLNIALSPEERGRGLSFPLMAHALRDTQEGGHRRAKGLPPEGWETAFLEVRVGNRPARALYARLGFQESGRRRHYYADGEDALIMTLDATGFRLSLAGEKKA